MGLAAFNRRRRLGVAAQPQQDNQPDASVFDGMTADELRQHAESLGIEIPANVTRPDTLIRLITQAQNG